MADFINTADVVGDEALLDSIIDKSITEFHDDTITTVGAYAFYQCKSLTSVILPNVETVGALGFYIGSSSSNNSLEMTTFDLPSVVRIEQGGFGLQFATIDRVVFPKLTGFGAWQTNYANIGCLDFHVLKTIHNNTFSMSSITSLILRKTDGICNLGGTSNSFDKAPSYIYVPAALIDTYKTATNWSTYADQFRALEDYTVDGTVTGDLDETKI